MKALRIMEDVRLGTLDFTLVKPADAQLLVSVHQSMYSARRWPVGIYPAWLRFILTFLVPIAFAVTVPAEGLVGRLTGPTLLTAILVALLILLISRLFWRFAIRYYSGASA